MHIPSMVASAKLMCSYCRGDKFYQTVKDGCLPEYPVKQRPYRSWDGGNFEHACAHFCKAYKIWDKIEELEKKAPGQEYVDAS